MSETCRRQPCSSHSSFISNNVLEYKTATRIHDENYYLC